MKEFFKESWIVIVVSVATKSLLRGGKGEGENMKDNKVTISKKNDGTCTVTLNGVQIDRVIDFSYSKSSATKSTEFILKFDVDELEEIFR